MDLITLLKKLQHITADPKYSARSRHAIMNGAHFRVSPKITLSQILRSSFETGATIVFASILFVLILGGFSITKKLSNTPLASLDTSSLKAEADAIDIQIELAEIYIADSIFSAPTTDMLTSDTIRVSPPNEAVNSRSASPDTRASSESAEKETIINAQSALEFLSR